mgnify:FL=1
MAQRQQIGKVAGYGNTSTPASRPVDTFSGAPAINTETSASALAKSFGLFTQSMAKRSQYDAKKAKDIKDAKDKSKLTSLAEKYRGQKGIISLIKTQTLHPEMSELNQLALTQAIASNETDDDMSQWIANLNNGTYGKDIWNNKKALTDLIDDKRSKLLDKYSVGKGDDGEWVTNEDGTRKTFDFAYEGAVKTFNQYINTHKREWESKRAKYQNDKFIEDHKKNTSRVLNEFTSNPKDGIIDFEGAYTAIESKFQQGDKIDSIRNDVRKKAIFEQIIETATSQTNPNTGLKILDNIPIRFQDKNSKDIVAVATKKIKAEATRQFNQSKQKENYLRNEGVISGSNIISQMYSGTFKPEEGGTNYGVTEYDKASDSDKNKAVTKFIRSQPLAIQNELIQFARVEADKDDALISKVDSLETYQITQSDIILNATQGKLGEYFKDNEWSTRSSGERKKIIFKHLNGLNMKKDDRFKLAEQVDTLLQGADVINNKKVTDYFDITIKASIDKNLRTLTGALNQKFVGAEATYANATRVYNRIITESIIDYIETNKRLPKFTNIGDKDDMYTILQKASQKTINIIIPDAAGKFKSDAEILNEIDS